VSFQKTDEKKRRKGVQLYRGAVENNRLLKMENEGCKEERLQPVLKS